LSLEIYNKTKNAILIVTAVLMGIIHIAQYAVKEFTLPSIMFYAIHLMFGVILVFLSKPLDRQNPARFWYLDLLCALAAIGVTGYVVADFDNYSMLLQLGSTPAITVMGLILALLVLEASRRLLGTALPLIALITIIYALFGGDLPGLLGHKPYTITRVISTIFSSLGLYGVPIGVSASNVYLFLLFAAFLGAFGADKIFQDLAVAFAGNKRGGPAKMAVISSCFFGSISGSAVANVVSTGAFTIPLMKREGYAKSFAGAVEAVASTGGQIMPPVMGAAAFVLSDITGAPYATVCIAALLPALMYYICLFKMVDLESVKLRMEARPKEDLPKVAAVVKRGLKLFIPVIVLLFLLLVVQTTPMSAAIYATIAIVVCSLFDKEDRFSLKKVVNGLVNAAKSATQVIAACATSGIVVGMLSLTGLGLVLSDFIIQLGGSNILISLVLAMLVCMVLGMGLPTTAAYIICATTIAPALVKLGLPVLPAHMFLLYFASISAITPPVAVASYAAAGIAEENSMKVGWRAVQLGIAGFMLPFTFTLNPDYLNLHFGVITIFTWISAFVVCYAAAYACQGWAEVKLTRPERILYLAVVALSIGSSYWLSLAGFAIFFLLRLSWRRRFQKIKPTAAVPLGN
jgi:TRAP transporter 4TM/12TM fusion protein